jgi:cobalt-zinc-cadmium efflux system outer membrane protein
MIFDANQWQPLLRSALPTATLLLLLLRVPVALAQSLTFDEALSTAVREAPVLRADTARIEAAQYAVAPAGELPDPELVLGLDNVPVEGEDRFRTGEDLMTMQRIGLMQAFTNPAKRRANSEMAAAQLELMQSDRREQRQTVLRETALAWIARHTWEQQLEQLTAWEQENALLDGVVRARLAGATGSALEGLMPQQEAAEIAALRDEFTTGREQSIAQLRRWIGAAAELPVSGSVPNWDIDAARLNHTLHQHPELLSFTSREHVLDADIAQSRAAKRPDWDVTVAWLERGNGYDDMAMLEVRVDLPLFPGSRQDPMIASKLAQRSALDADREASLREHAAMLQGDIAEYQRLQRSEQRFNAVLLPLADRKVTLALASWRSGEGELTDVIAARRDRIATRLKSIATTGERQLAAARLHYAYSDIDDNTANKPASNPATNSTGTQP